ncbi:MAG TPA: octanoyltransferase, partial [Verrucomicrobiae bacterium]
MSWLYVDTGKGESAWNMALDEVLLNSISAIGRPVLRFYGWTDTAATFGYFQKYADIAAWTPLRPLIRRPTGGGLVPHDADWTYSVIIPPSHPWYELRAAESYLHLHRWV